MIRRVLAWLSYGVAYKADAEATWRPYESPRVPRPTDSPFGPVIAHLTPRNMDEALDNIRHGDQLHYAAHDYVADVLDGIAAATRAEETQRAIAGHVSDRNRIEGIDQ